MYGSTPRLYELIKEQKWHLVSHHVVTFPQDLYWRDDRGYTAFHRLCCLPGILQRGEEIAAVAACMLRVAEQINFQCKNIGQSSQWTGARALVVDQGCRACWSPLHLVCGYCGHLSGRENVVRVILIFDELGYDSHDIIGLGRDMSEKQKLENLEFRRYVVSLRDRQKKNALHHLLKIQFKASKVGPVLRLILPADTSAAVALDKEGSSPLSLSFSNVTGICLENHDRYIIANLMVTIMYEHYKKYSMKSNEGNILHFSFSLSSAICPQILLLSIIANHRVDSDFKEFDEDNNLPLHVFISNVTHFLPSKESNEETTTAPNRGTRNNSRSLNRPERLRRKDVTNRLEYQDMIIHALLRAYPDSAQMNGMNRQNCFNLALKSGVTWNNGLRTLLEAHPANFEFIDIDMKLYPYLISTVCSKNGDVSANLSIVYNIIKARPDIVKLDGVILPEEMPQKESKRSFTSGLFKWMSFPKNV